MHKLSLLLALLLIFVNSKAQKLSIPYDILLGVPVVKLSIEGKSHNFVFDTGAFKTLINSEVFPNLPISSKVENVGGAGSVRKSMDQVEFSFSFLNRHFKNKEVIYSDLSILTKASCDNLVLSGIIGRDIIENYIIEIDPLINKITFHNLLKFNENQILDFTKIKLSNSSDPRVAVKIGKQTRYVLFDTGRNGDLSISDYKLNKYINNTQHISYVNKGSAYGVHGIITDKDLNHKIYDADIQLGKFIVKRQIVETSRNDFNNMGFNFISQFRTYLDLKGKKLYLKQISENYVGESSLKRLGFNIRYDAEQKKNIIVSLSTKNDKLKLGDNLISINGEIPPVNNCNMYSFLQKFFCTPIKIKVERENKIIEIEQSSFSSNLLKI